MNSSKCSLLRCALQIGLCLLFGIGLSALALALCAAVLCRVTLSANAAMPMAAASAALGSFGAAWLLVRLRGSKGLLCGLFCGGFFCAAFLVAVRLTGHTVNAQLILLKSGVFLLSGVLGGYCGLPRPRLRRR